MRPNVTSFFHRPTYTVTHVVADAEGGRCAIIDPVLDYAPNACRTSTDAADAVIAFVRDRGLHVDWILETHAHADHLTAAPYLKAELGGRIGIGAEIGRVQEAFKTLFNAGDEFPTDGSQFDHLFTHEEVFEIGGVPAWVMHTPGHTPACVTYVIGDAAFVGDTMFMPDYGTARVDFPGGDAATLYRSIRAILSLPAETRLFMCHDYCAPGRKEFAWETTVGDERKKNVHVREGVSEADFVEMRNRRDEKLDVPALILPSLQVNMRAGALPAAEDNGIAYLRLPLNAL
jgi:glyoxylase-like metal-dependent hydrolase (beta-lactamase superfamily II)